MPAWGKERYERGLLWRVSKDGKAPSHIFGTIHDADARVAGLPAPAAAAFARARTLLVEFLPDAYTRERFTEAALLPDRQTLEEKIGAEDFQRVIEALGPSGLGARSSASSSRGVRSSIFAIRPRTRPRASMRA